jgi:hypothetical protein
VKFHCNEFFHANFWYFVISLVSLDDVLARLLLGVSALLQGLINKVADH